MKICDSELIEVIRHHKEVLFCWLGSVVGKEAEDLSRQDKWLCMMYPRIMLLKQFLREDGAIFVSIDDHKVASLRRRTRSSSDLLFS